MEIDFDQSLFKGYDVRGIYGENLTEDSINLIGKGFGTFLKEGKTIYVGHDPRTSSESLENSFIEGITSCGINVIKLGMVPTPLLSYAVAMKNCDGSEITASHNPPIYNGVKMYFEGKDLSAQIMGEILQIILKNTFRISKIKGEVKSISLSEEYVNFISSKFKTFKPLKIVVDTGNGACGLVAPVIYEKIGCKVEKLFTEPDGTFPNHPADPHKEETLKWIKEKVISSKANLGIALDGDGDRVAFIDHLGRKVRSDDAMIIFSKFLLKQNRNSTIVFDLRMTDELAQVISSNSGIPIQCACGRTNVSKAMRENDAILGGEQTGHTFFKEMFYHDDAIFVGAKMIMLLSATALPLASMVDELEHYPSTPELRIKVDNERKYEIVKRALVHFTELSKTIGAVVITLDGVRLNLKSGAWGLLRVSNTEPAITMRFEAKNQTDLLSCYELFRQFLTENQVEIPKEVPI